MNGITFQFAVLRYIHDPATEEFINVGVVLYSQEARYLKSLMSTKYSRLSRGFQEINGEYYRNVVGYIQRHLTSLHYRYHQQYDLLDAFPAKIETILSRILPPDDSSFVFGRVGSGVTIDLESELQRLYERLVDRYVEKEEPESRSDQQVWQVYSQELDKYQVTLHLSPVTIQTATYNYPFDHAWKNDLWHPMEPVSFDLIQERSIPEKANRWIGRALSLAPSDQIGTLYMLLGAPRAANLQDAYKDATENIKRSVSDARIKVELVEEQDAPTFSKRLADMIVEHEEEKNSN